MRHPIFTLIFTTALLCACNSLDTTAPIHEQIKILKMEKVQPNLLDLTIKNCYDQRTFVIIDVYLIRDDSTCASAHFSPNERNGIEPEETVNLRKELMGILLHHQNYQ